MPRDKKKYLLDDEKKIKLLQESRIINLATINKNGLPHLVPMWFILDANNEINFTSYHKSQKIINLKRDKRIVIMIESGTHYEELHGLVLEGEAEISTDEALIIKIMNQITAKYKTKRNQKDIAKQANKRVNVKVKVKKIISWDIGKS